ncbi:hypothetical protein Tco_1419427 [Tanacetum coccineum]
MHQIFHSMLHPDSSSRHSIVQIILLLIYRVLLWGHLARDVDVEVDPREISLRDDAIVRVSDEPHLEQDIDPEIQAEIDEYNCYADCLFRDRWIDAREIANTRKRSRASMTHEEVEELVNRRVAEEMEAREAARTLEPLNENGDEQEGENGGNGNGGNGGNGNGGNRGNGNGGNGENRNGNRNGNHGMNYGGFMPVARECTFQDFLKCKPHNFSRTEGVVRLTRWFKEMETVFNINNCPPKYQVKYATCTLQDSALTWWNSHKRTIWWECDMLANRARLQDCYNALPNQLMDKEAPRLCCKEVAENKRRWKDISGGIVQVKESEPWKPDKKQEWKQDWSPPTTLDTSYAVEHAMERNLENKYCLKVHVRIIRRPVPGLPSARQVNFKSLFPVLQP